MRYVSSNHYHELEFAIHKGSKMLSMAGYIWACLLITVITYITWKLLAVFSKHKQWCEVGRKIPGPPTHFFWGNTHQIYDIDTYYKVIWPLIQEHRWKVFRGWVFFFFPVLCVVHPDTAKVILKSSEPKQKGFGGAYRHIMPWLGDGLLISDGPKWERNRRLLTPAFHFDILQPYVTVYNQVADTFLNKLAQKTKNGESTEVCGDVGLATLDTMLQCALSYKGNIQNEREADPYVHAVHRLTHLLVFRCMRPMLYPDIVFYLSSSGKEFRQHCDYVHEFAEKVICARKEKQKGTEQLRKNRLDFLDILLAARDESGKGLTDKEIRDEVDTFMFEGHDTTASGISWAIFCLGKYPEEQEKVYEEVKGKLEGRQYVEWDDLNKLKLLQCFLREVMRMYAPVPAITRLLTKSCMLDGVEIPPGTAVDVNMHMLNHHPDVWPDHMDFRPERFRLENVLEKDPYKYVPFSAGPRNCIGQHFAMNEQKVLIARLVHRFKVGLDTNHEVVELPEVVMRAKYGIKVTLEQRL